jgi:hypothetical protein
MLTRWLFKAAEETDQHWQVSTDYQAISIMDGLLRRDPDRVGW